MGSRELEVIFLKKIDKVNNKFQLMPFVDLIYNPKLTLPRVVSRTALVPAGAFMNKKEGIYEEITIYKHNISFTFVIDDTVSFDEILEIHKILKHEVKNNWESQRENKNYVVLEVTNILDISEIGRDGITRRYLFEVIVTTQESASVNIGVVKKVEFNLKGVEHGN